MKNLQLTSGLPMFQPKQRLAILVNNWDNYEGYRRSDIYSRGNRRIYEMEFDLTGSHSFDIQNPDEQIALRNLEELESALKNRSSGEKISDKEVWQRKRKDLKYSHCVKIFPGQLVRRAFNEATVELGKLSSPETLTFVYYHAHGAPDKIGMGDGEIEYRHLLTLLNRISGKKVVVVPSCYSGSILTALEFLAKPEDYVLIASARRQQKAITHGDDDFDMLISNHLYSGEPLSKLQLPEELGEDQNPIILGHFDVSL